MGIHSVECLADKLDESSSAAKLAGKISTELAELN